MPRFAATLLIALLPLGFLALLLIAPLLAMLGYDNAAPLWQEMLHDAYYRKRLLWTLAQAAITAAAVLLLGIPVAWVLARLSFRGRALILRLLMLPFIMPTLVAGMGVLALFGQHGVLWHGWADTPYLLLYGNVFFNLPVAIRAAYQGMLAVPANRLHAARTLGANAWQRFRHIELPVLTPWLGGAACLVFLYCFSGFGLALLLGGQHYATVEVEIYQLIAYELDMERAAVLVWLVLGITAFAGSGYAWLGSKTRAAHRQPLPRIAPSCTAHRLLLCAALLVLSLFCALPLLAVLVQALRAGASWQVLWETDTLAALWNTFRFTLAALAAALLLGISHAALARRIPTWRSITFLPFMVSPVCIAFGVLLLYPDWSDSLLLLIALYAMLAYPFVCKDLLAAWDALPPNYTAAARIFGARPLKAAAHVTLPLLLPALRRGLTLAAATCIGEFAATLFLSRPEWNTLTTLIYQHLGRVGIENHDKALVLTCLLMLLAGSAFILLDASERQTQQP